MRKILLVGIITLLLLSGSQSLATDERQPSYEQKTISFYQLSQLDKGSFLTVDLKGADIPFFMQNHYIVPTKIETYTFPYGTTIESVSVTNEKIHSLSLKQPLQLAPPARLLDGQIHDIETSIKSDPVALSEWFTYDIGSGIFDDLHQIIVKIQLFPVQYDPIGNTIEWTEEMTLDIKYTLPKKT
ncbi:MAG: hypothetical protein QCH96_07440, partial [Candidatus Thermoplasmatota archaeon]|nr:hypothetical protein [Candidatus Thermoplasmatota archaeon]